MCLLKGKRHTVLEPVRVVDGAQMIHLVPVLSERTPNEFQQRFSRHNAKGISRGRQRGFRAGTQPDLPRQGHPGARLAVMRDTLKVVDNSFSDGIRIPPTRLYKKGELQSDILELILHNGANQACSISAEPSNGVYLVLRDHGYSHSKVG